MAEWLFVATKEQGTMPKQSDWSTVKLNYSKFRVGSHNVLHDLSKLSYRQLVTVAKTFKIPTWVSVRNSLVWLEKKTLAARIAHDVVQPYADEGRDDEAAQKLCYVVANKDNIAEASVPSQELPQSMRSKSGSTGEPQVIVKEKIVKVPVEVVIEKVVGYRLMTSEGETRREGELVLPEEFQDILDLAQERMNIMLVGPSGCGKSFIGEELAKALELEFSSISCSIGLSEAKVSGWLLPIESNGAFGFVPADFVNRYENGGVFLLDEIDAADANMLVYMNQALANDSFFLPQRRENTRVKRHPDFVCVAAANTFGHGADMIFVGRNQLDGATLDRFRMGTISMDYSRDVERSLCDPAILEWGWDLRDQISRHRLRRFVSTRFMRDATRMMRSKNWDLDKIQSKYFSDWKEDEMNKVGVSR